MNRRRKLLAAITIAAACTSLAAPFQASANYCADHSLPSVPPAQGNPIFAIGSGYYGTGGPGPLDQFGCLNGQQVADTRLIMPEADFIVIVLQRAQCDAGHAFETLSINGLGIKVTKQRMTCFVGTQDALGLPNNRAYVSGIFEIEGSGKVTASLTYQGKTYNAEARTIL